MTIPYPQPTILSPSFLQGKKVMLVAANFFGLHRVIMTGLNELGAEVDYFDERPANDFLTKSMIRINRNLLGPKIDKYYDSFIKSTQGKDYDYVLIIKGECISPKSLELIRKLHPRAKLILYQWDSVTYNSNFFKIKHLFDRLTSFDPYDSQKYGLVFLPHFYTEDYAKIGLSKRIPENDLLFVGTVHYDRYQLVRKVAKAAESAGCKVALYLYFQHKLMYIKKKYIDRQLKDSKYSEFNFKPLSHTDLLHCYENSRMILDIQKPKQEGLTLRPFEALGAKRKLITTSADIINYNFYSPDNILVIDRESPSIPANFFHTPYKPLPEEIYKAYTLHNWLANQFNV